MYQIVFYVPGRNKEAVKEAMFAVGAGAIGNYSKCSFESSGKGQFLPMEGSSPTLGQISKLKKLREFRVEMVCSDEKIEEAIKALIKVHPYEVPAYRYYRINDTPVE